MKNEKIDIFGPTGTGHQTSGECTPSIAAEPGIKITVVPVAKGSQRGS